MKLRFVVGATLVVCSSGLHAQQKSSGTNALVMTIGGFGYGSYLVQALDSIPEGKYGYKPTPIQQSVGFIAQHVENANYELCALLGDESYVKSAKDSLADSVKATWPKDTLVARVRKSLDYCRGIVLRLEDRQLSDTMRTVGANAGQLVIRLRYLMLLVTDLAEHYSQIAVYMRLNGMVPPSALPVVPKQPVQW